MAVVLTVERVLAATGRRWAELHIAMLGYGAIGRGVLALARHVLGEPAAISLCDPALPDGAPDLDGADLVIAAVSGGPAIDPRALSPGTLVVDDSFPRAFDDRAAIGRMSTARDVVLVGGGLLDVGPLVRRSPFPQADALRAQYGARWLPGCHAEAVLLAAEPSLGPTVGVVDLARGRLVYEAVLRAGWTSAPLHLGAWMVPDDVLDRVRR